MIKIDLRSDTVTLPHDGMRRAIYDAGLGNSGYGQTSPEKWS